MRGCTLLAGKEVDTDSIIERCWRTGATASIRCTVEG